MNFLAHDVVLPRPSPSLTRVGATLPDLWILLPKRPLPFAIVRELRNSADQDAQQVAAGIEHHLRADAVFHGHEEFLRRVALATQGLKSLLPEIRHAQLAAHVAVEMVLDRWLMDRDPRIVDEYYESFTSSVLERVAALAGAQHNQSVELRSVLNRFADSAFLREYCSSELLVRRWLRSLSRTPFAQNSGVDEKKLAGLVERMTAEFAEGSAALLEDVRTGVAEWKPQGRSVS